MPAVLDPIRTAPPDVDELQELWDGSTGDDEDLCHLAMHGGDDKALCGAEKKGNPCDGDWKGEAVCPHCGKVVCPECMAIARKLITDAADGL